jgi:peroxiredoxin
LRDDDNRFQQAGATVVAIAPDDAEGVAKFTRENSYPFPLLADADHRVFDAYDVQSRMQSLGQRPAVFIVDRDGIVRFDAVGSQQWQIPSNDVVFGALESCARC